MGIKKKSVNDQFDFPILAIKPAGGCKENALKLSVPRTTENCHPRINCHSKVTTEWLCHSYQTTPNKYLMKRIKIYQNHLKYLNAEISIFLQLGQKPPQTFWSGLQGEQVECLSLGQPIKPSIFNRIIYSGIL